MAGIQAYIKISDPNPYRDKSYNWKGFSKHDVPKFDQITVCPKIQCDLYIQPMLMLSALQFSQKIFDSIRNIQKVEGEDWHSQYAGVVRDELAWHKRWYLGINLFIICLLPICLTLSYGPYKALTQTLVTFLSTVFKLVCVLVISFIGRVTLELSCFKMTWNIEEEINTKLFQ